MPRLALLMHVFPCQKLLSSYRTSDSLTIMIGYALALMLTLLAFAATAVKRVPAGQVHSLYRHGKPVRLLQQGLHVVMPLLDHIAHRIDMVGHTLSFDVLTAARSMHGLVYWQVLEPERADAVIEHAEQLIQQNVRDALQADTAAVRDEDSSIATRLKQALNEHLRQCGMMVIRVELEATY